MIKPRHNGSAASLGPTVHTMSSSDRSGHDRVERLGPGDDVKVEWASALFDHPARADATRRLAIDRPRWQPGADPEMEPAPPSACDAPG
jgi:hypothetical protein